MKNTLIVISSNFLSEYHMSIYYKLEYLNIIKLNYLFIFYRFKEVIYYTMF